MDEFTKAMELLGEGARNRVVRQLNADMFDDAMDRVLWQVDPPDKDANPAGYAAWIADRLRGYVAPADVYAAMAETLADNPRSSAIIDDIGEP